MHLQCKFYLSWVLHHLLFQLLRLFSTVSTSSTSAFARLQAEALLPLPRCDAASPTFTSPASTFSTTLILFLLPYLYYLFYHTYTSCFYPTSTTYSNTLLLLVPPQIYYCPVLLLLSDAAPSSTAASSSPQAPTLRRTPTPPSSEHCSRTISFSVGTKADLHFGLITKICSLLPAISATS